VQNQLKTSLASLRVTIRIDSELIDTIPNNRTHSKNLVAGCMRTGTDARLLDFG